VRAIGQRRLLEAIMGAEAMGIVQVDLKVISPLLMQ
jgi:hypothetical protein